MWVWRNFSAHTHEAEAAYLRHAARFEFLYYTINVEKSQVRKQKNGGYFFYSFSRVPFLFVFLSAFRKRVLDLFFSKNLTPDQFRVIIYKIMKKLF